MTEEEKEKAPIQLYVRFIVKRKDGSIKFDSGKRKANCFVLQFLQIICAYFKNGDVTPVKDVTGTNRTIGNPGGYNKEFYMRVDAPSGDSSYGIVVGTGTTTPTNADYKLESQCTHGTGANQFLHGSVGLTTPQVAAGNVDCARARKRFLRQLEVQQKEFERGKGLRIGY
jgi:hypothetical protein